MARIPLLLPALVVALQVEGSVISTPYQGKKAFELSLKDEDFSGLEGLELTEEDIKLLTPQWEDFEQIKYTLGLIVRENKAAKVRSETVEKEKERIDKLAKMKPIYDETTPKAIKLVTPETYEQLFAFPTKNHVFLEIYADWCGHCQSAAPEFKQAAELYAPAKNVLFAALNGDKYRDLYSKFPSGGYPSFYFLPAGSKNESDAVAFDKSRQANHFVKFLNTHTKANITIDGEEDEEKPSIFQDSKVHIMNPFHFHRTVAKKHCLVYVYADWCKACQAFAPIYAHIAEKFEGIDKVMITALNADEAPELLKEYGVTHLPAYFFFKKGSGHSSKPDQITGEVNPYSLVDLVNEKVGTSVLLEGMEPKDYSEMSDEEEAKLAQLAGEEEEEADADGMYAGTDVVQLTNQNFDQLVFESKKHAVVEFYAPWCGFCKKLKPAYLNLGASYSTHAKDVIIGAIDADEYQAFVHEHGYQVRGYPTILFFAKGSSPDSDGEEYVGDFTEADLLKWTNKLTGLRGRKVNKKRPDEPSAVEQALRSAKEKKSSSVEKLKQQVEQLEVAAKVRELEDKLKNLMDKKAKIGQDKKGEAETTEDGPLPPADQDFSDEDEETPDAQPTESDSEPLPDDTQSEL
jgi:protein disulfide-isomerase-like protein